MKEHMAQGAPVISVQSLLETATRGDPMSPLLWAGVTN
jgi:hypothetical protein